MEDLKKKLKDLEEKYKALEKVHKDVLVKYDELQADFNQEDIFLLNIAIVLQGDPAFKDTDVAKYVVDKIHYYMKVNKHGYNG